MQPYCKVYLMTIVHVHYWKSLKCFSSQCTLKECSRMKINSCIFVPRVCSLTQIMPFAFTTQTQGQKARPLIRPRTRRFSVSCCPGGSAGEFCICLGQRGHSPCAGGRSSSSWCDREPLPTLRSEPGKEIRLSQRNLYLTLNKTLSLNYDTNHKALSTI